MTLTPLGKIENARLTVIGDLTIKTLGQARFQRLPKLPQKLQVDCGGITHCDSTGVAALVWLLQQGQKQHCTIVWQHIPVPVERLLALYQLDDEELIADAGKSD